MMEIWTVVLMCTTAPQIQEIIKTTAKKSQEELALKDQAKKDRTKETEMSKEVISLKSKVSVKTLHKSKTRYISKGSN